MTDELEDRLRSDLPQLADSALSLPSRRGRGDVADGVATKSGAHRTKWLVGAAALVGLMIVAGIVLLARSRDDTEVVTSEGNKQTDLVPVAGAVVEIDIYSGRPNPIWGLTPENAGQVRSVIGDLKATSQHAPTEEPLGLRGFTITGDDGSLIVVRPQQVDIKPHGGPERALDDPSGLLMAQLVSMSLQHTDDAGLKAALSAWEAGG